MILDNMLTDPAGLSFPVLSGGPDATVTQVPGELVFAAQGGASIFHAGEPVTLRSIRPMYPYQFGWGASVRHGITILHRVSGGGLQIIPELGPGSTIFLGNLCDTIDLGLNIKAPKTAGVYLSYQFVMQFQFVAVSMQNVPAGLNGQTMNPAYMITVEHTQGVT